jgi:hypothetical protein
MQNAYGRISPKIKTKVVDIMIAQAEGTKASRKMGNDSIAKALHNKRVESKRCLSFITGMIFLTWFFSNSFPFIKSISNYSESKDE